jgi:hypothetical protein
VPVLGYEVRGPGGATVYYTGDNGPGCHQNWLKADPNLLITEVTFGNLYPDLAKQVGHLSPARLQIELERFRAVRGRLPRILALHLAPDQVGAIRQELAEVGKALQHQIEIAEQGQIIELSPA